MVALSDVLPTILEACGMPVPDPPAIIGRPLQGVAFAKVPEQTVVSEISHRGFVSSGIRTGQAKYIRRFSPQADELPMMAAMNSASEPWRPPTPPASP